MGALGSGLYSVDNVPSGCLSHQHPINDNINKIVAIPLIAWGASGEKCCCGLTTQPSPHSMGRDFHFTDEEMGVQEGKEGCFKGAKAPGQQSKGPN